MRNIRISLGFDMRAPDLGTSTRDLYAAAIEMAAHADDVGIDSINLMEHHASEDGYLPQPFILASAMAGQTKRIHFMLGAVILPLHDPVDMAERIAVLDLVSGGRFNVIFGAGYVPGEFAMFGKSLKDRAKLMDEGVETILRALDGESFDYQGRPVMVRPLPIRDPRDIVMVGGGVPASARRAARFDVGFGPMKGDIVDIYLAECEKHGREPRTYYRPGGGMPLGIHLCEDPEAGWAALEPHALHVVTEYAKWAALEGDATNSPFKGLDNPEALRRSGLFVAMTPEQLLGMVSANPEINMIGLHPLLGGLAPEEGWKSLKLLESILPKLREL
ncbi:MAG: LLM class flavin-dependent oxidoreductase [Novosphingobium sp.]|nr:LLM class flavin-dependent oxidoreductase [Novosphingobium sp.]